MAPIGIRLADLPWDRYRIGKGSAGLTHIRLAMDWHRIGDGLALDWRRIGDGLALDWHQVGTGLAKSSSVQTTSRSQ